MNTDTGFYTKITDPDELLLEGDEYFTTDEGWAKIVCFVGAPRGALTGRVRRPVTPTPQGWEPKELVTPLGNLNPTDPKGAAGSLKTPLHLLPVAIMEETAWVLKGGAERYGLRNYRHNKVCASTYISAIMRHLNKWREREDLDTESGRSHLAHIAANCAILMDAAAHGTLEDDRA